AGAGGQAPAGNQTAPAPPPAPRPLVPVTAASVMKAPDRYIGETVTLTGIVDRGLSVTTFTVDQNAAQKSDDAVLVIARRELNRPVVEDEYVTIVGELIKYDAAEIAKRTNPAFATHLAADATSAWAGRPVVLATTVFQGSEDIAMRMPPPANPAEEPLDKAMKAIGPANGAFRKGMAASNAELTAKNLAIIRDAFDETERFFRSQRMREPQRWAEDARKVTEGMQKAVAAGNWTAVKAGAENLGKACANCHTPYRDRYDDGTFRLKRPDGGQ
ncbi:MAG: hypothetical protein ACLGHP_04045, partial [Vicinamibacteria bacterium]